MGILKLWNFKGRNRMDIEEQINDIETAIKAKVLINSFIYFGIVQDNEVAIDQRKILSWVLDLIDNVLEGDFEDKESNE